MRAKTRAGGATGSPPPAQGGDGRSNRTPALQINPRMIEMLPVPHRVAQDVLVRHHYLHSMPGGTKLTFGVFTDSRLRGAVSLGVGPINGHRLVEGATRDDCLTLTRLWLEDDLPKNSESRLLGVLVRALRRSTRLKFLLSYADPGVGHVGTVYQAAGWLYTGVSEAQPLMDLGDGVPRHLRSVGSAFGTHSAAYLRRRGLPVRLVPQAGKHRYVVFVDPTWRIRLLVPVLPYPKRGG